MPELASAFIELLVLERKAALRADVDELASLQLQKRELLAKLQASDVDREIIVDLGERAKANIVLIRHLVTCLRGMTEPPGDPMYTAKGEARSAGARLVRGTL